MKKVSMMILVCICLMSTSCKYFINPKVIVISKYQNDTLFTKETASKETMVFTDNIVFSDMSVRLTAEQIANKTGMTMIESESLLHSKGTGQVIVKEKEIPRSTWELVGKWIFLIGGIGIGVWLLLFMWLAALWNRG
jgi:hypothetical protein